MRILQISSARGFGESERHLVDLCRELTRRGHDVFVALRPTSEWQQRLDFLPPENFLHVSIRNSFGMFSSKKITRFILKNQIDIVHAHASRDYLAANIASRSVKGTKFVLTRHVVRPMKPFHRFALRNVAAAIAVSPEIRSQLERIFPVEKIRLILNGIDPGTGDTQSKMAMGATFRTLHAIPIDTVLVVTLGELKVANGQRDLVLAANEVVKQFPDARFVVAGMDRSIDKKFRRELKRLVRVLGLDENFLWLDWIDDIAPLFAAADLYISPLHSGALSQTLIEAMSAGTPVIATAIDVAGELIADEKALVPVKDPIALAEKICWLLKNADARRDLGEKLRTDASERFGLAQMVDSTEGLYRDACTMSEPLA
ncbi:MAG: glycosyltransferase family 4 protein [Pyrinomonadaceae bacterium]